MSETRRVAIVVFDDVEVLDFCGPFEVFSVAGRLSDPPAFDVYTVAQTPGAVTARHELSLNPKYTLSEAPQADILVVPGGLGTRTEMHNTTLVEWIRRTAAPADLVLSVCTGALLLGRAGLLDGRDVTTHHVAYDLLREVVPTAEVHEDRRYVDTGKIITSAGISAGIDMSLHVVERLEGQDLAARTARQMEYAWK